MAFWYLGSTRWTAVPAWSAAATATIGDFVRQSGAVTVGNERVWRCTTGGTTGGSQPSWNLTKASTTNDNGVVWTEVTGNETYGWDAAHARLSAALSHRVVGDIILMSDNHAETQTTALTVAATTDSTNPDRIICVDDSAFPPTTLATTGTVSCTNGTNMVLQGHAYSYGVTYTAGSGAVVTQSIQFNSIQPWWWKIEQGGLHLNTNEANGEILVGASSTSADAQGLELVNATITFGHVGHGIVVRAPFHWRGGALATNGATVLFQTPTAGNFGNTDVRGVDLSLMASGKTLVDIGNSTFNHYHFENCELGASVSITTGSNLTPAGPTVDVINCDSADTNYRLAMSRYAGTITHETTIVRTGGANDGATGLSRKMVSNANCKTVMPLTYDGIIVRNSDVGSPLTLTVEVVTDNVTLEDDEAWIEVEYLGTSGTPLSLFANDGIGILTTPSAQPTSGETWTTTGLTTPVKQYLAVTFTPEEAGPIRVRVMLGRPSTTMYVCPKVTVS